MHGSDAYEDGLAHIHDVGSAELARYAAMFVRGELRQIGPAKVLWLRRALTRPSPSGPIPTAVPGPPRTASGPPIRPGRFAPFGCTGRAGTWTAPHE
jgi:hypothetical protein